MIKIKRVNSFLIIFLLLIIILCCQKNKNNETDVALQKDTNLKAEELKRANFYGVVRVDRLRFRSDNDLSSKTLRYLDKGTIVSVIKKDKKRVRIGQNEDYWYNIEYDGIKGWVFGYFLDTYSSYEDAKKQANYIMKQEFENIKENFYYDDAIDNNLFFLSNGKILQVTDGQSGKAKKLNTQSNLFITYYFFSNDSSKIFYIARQNNNFNENGSLYSYEIEKEKNSLITKNVYSANYNFDKNILLLVSKSIKKKEYYWKIFLMHLEDTSKMQEIATIKQNKSSDNIENDLLSKTLQRELGSLVHLKLDKENNFIYFKPPEENLTYLISTSNGEYIQVESDESLYYYNIDSSRYITITFEEDESSGESIYTIILKDKFSGMEKELLHNKLYPINFCISPRQNLLAISMINLNEIKNDYYTSSIYVLSLLTYSLMAISTEGNSYQPKWSRRFIK